MKTMYFLYNCPLNPLYFKMIIRNYSMIFEIKSACRNVHNQKFINLTRSNNNNMFFCKLKPALLRLPSTHLIAKSYSDMKTSINKEKFDKFSKIEHSSEDLLEKLMAGLSGDIHQKHRVYKNYFVKVVNKVKELGYSSKKQGIILIKCCGELLPDETAATKLALVEDVWNTLKPQTKFDVDHYNELLRVYIANNKSVSARDFFKQMEPVKPNHTTYELILRALGEMGDINQAMEVISNMKAAGLPATEAVFNSLILCQGKIGNIENLQEIQTMMKSLKIESSVNTHTAIAIVYAWNKMYQALLDELATARKQGVVFGERHIMQIVKTLASVDSIATIKQVLRFLPEDTLKSPSISPYMQSVATSLVFSNYPLVALEIYNCLPLPSFGPKDDQALHGRSLVRDCVKASAPTGVISLITQELMSSGRNPLALQNAAEASLQLGKVPLSLDLFSRMQQLGMPIRPHYFWPILLHASKTYGEKGIMNTLSSMVTMGVKPDYETLMNYALPFVSFTSPQNLMKKLLDTGLSVTNVLTAMMETLLNMGQVRAASEICELFQGKVDIDRILKPLIKGYLMTYDVKSTIYILQDSTSKAVDRDRDWVGKFLCEFIKHNKLKRDFTDFINLIKALKETPLKISPGALDFCLSRLPSEKASSEIEAAKTILVEMMDERIVDEGDMSTNHMLLHPKQMNEESLNSHLKELEAKGMNTRGVLRKLLQEYCRLGNMAGAKEIEEKCRKEGIHLSAGMKASVFDLHVKMGELELAEATLADLANTSPNFLLDEYKVIDFATLMVYRKKIDKACSLITEQSRKRRVQGGRNVEMNCWRLLDATAAHGAPPQVRKVFDLLHSLGYCRPTNAILGPLIRVHLKHDNIQGAVTEFEQLANKYNKTPLKHELLCKILVEMGDRQSEESFIMNEKSDGRLNRLAQTVLSVGKKVHGPGDVQLTLIGALAEVGFKRTLRKLFLEPQLSVHPDGVRRRCERFADERKTRPIETIAECAAGTRHVDAAALYDLILDVHQRDDNCPDALLLWRRMQDADVAPSQTFLNNLYSLLKANNRPVPPELNLLCEKQKIIAKS